MIAEKPRQIAARILKERLQDAQYTENLLEIESALHPLSPPDRALCQELVYGVTRWQRPLDWLIARKTAGRTQKPLLRILLQLGLYQMFWLDRIPNHAAVNETVELARQSGFGPQSGFVNAVLRGYAREKAETEALLAQLKSQDPPLGHSHPEWLYQRWLARWGADSAIRLMEWNNSPPPTFARVNTLKTTPEQIVAQWQTEGVELDFGHWPWIPSNLVIQLKSHPPLTSLPSFQQGLFYIQDPSTLLAVTELNPQPGDPVLDLCAAPGGKTTFIAQLMQNRGLIVARDLHPDRLARVRENCDRLGVTCVNLEVSPASADAASGVKFDKILIDAPCSNTGVMRRRVDLRWRIRPEEIDRLRATQSDLLRQAAAQLNPGGTLVYSTCSLEPGENDDVVNAFLQSHPAFKLETRRELHPFTDRVDGAYVARLKASR